jgi:hypothetical protein
MSGRKVCCLVFCALVEFAAALNSSCQAQSVLLESATLGLTGRDGGASVTNVQYIGWRFELAETLQVEQVGGHMLSLPDKPGDIFAALVRLASIDSFPAGAPFTSEEVVATTLFRPNFPSDEILTPLSAELTPGSYALVFGTELFGATGEAAIHNGFDQDDISPTNIASFIFWSLPGVGQPPIWRTNLASHMRFLVQGQLAGIAGDFDEDGDVDGRDFLTWQRDTSVGDLADWQANFGSGAMSSFIAAPAAADSSNSGASSVPEPTSIALGAAALGLLLLKYFERFRMS